MNTQTTIQLRIDIKTKLAAQKTFEDVGLDLSSAIKLFLRNVVITKSIPLELRTKNGFTLKQEMKILADTAEAERSGKRYTDIDLMLREI